MKQRVACVSVDMDDVDCYQRIHGLGAGTGLEDPAGTVYKRGLPRLRRMFDRCGIRGTFFVIGKDAPHHGEALRSVLEDGYEVSNHSLNHEYDLSRMGRDQMRHEVRGGADAIEAAVGVRPVGFRAPGYIVSDGLFDVLDEEGILYDSSVFPCPGYWGAKTAVLTWMRCSGKRSESVVDNPRVMTAPANPYRVNRPYWHRGLGTLEIPIGVTRGTTGRLPFIGTSLTMAGAQGAKQLAHAIAGRPLVNLELHGIDLCDAELDGLQALLAHQPDLRRTVEEKEGAIVAAIEALQESGYGFTTLSDAASMFT